MDPSQRPLPPVVITTDDEKYETTENLSFRMSMTLIARSLMGISTALTRVADTLEKERREGP